MSPSKKFLLGFFLIVGNFILGKLALPFFAISMELGLAIYLFSWLMLVAGLVLCGREGLTWARHYYRHFEKKLKKHMMQGWKITRQQKPPVRNQTRAKQTRAGRQQPAATREIAAPHQLSLMEEHSSLKIFCDR